MAERFSAANAVVGASGAAESATSSGSGGEGAVEGKGSWISTDVGVPPTFSCQGGWFQPWKHQISIGLGVDVAAARPRRSVYWIFKCFLWKWLNKMIFWDSIVISIFLSFYFLLISSKISPVNQIYKEQAGVFPAHTSWVIKASYGLHIAFE